MIESFGIASSFSSSTSSGSASSVSSARARQEAEPGKASYLIDTSEFEKDLERLMSSAVFPTKIVVEKIKSSSLSSRADEGFAEIKSQFNDLFLNKFDSDGSWVKNGISSEKYQGIVSSLEQYLQNGDYDSARFVVSDYLSEVSELARKHLLDVGAQNARMLHNELFDQFSGLVFAGFGGQSIETMHVSQYGGHNSGEPDSSVKAIATQIGTSESAFFKDTNAPGVNVDQKLPDEKEPDDGVDGVGDLFEDVIKDTQQVYYSRLNSLYGRGDGAPGMQQAVEAAMDKLNTYFRNAYRNKYTEDAESILEKSAETLAGALFGSSGIDLFASSAAAVANGKAEEVEASAATDEDGQSVVGRIFFRAAHSNTGSSDLLFEDLKEIFMSKLEQAIDGRTLGRQVAVYEDPPLYSDKGRGAVTQHGATWERTV